MLKSDVFLLITKADSKETVGSCHNALQSCRTEIYEVHGANVKHPWQNRFFGEVAIVRAAPLTSKKNSTNLTFSEQQFLRTIRITAAAMLIDLA